MYFKLTERFGKVLYSLGKALKRARSGNVAILFALTVTPILITGGAGIDLARAMAVRSKLYAAVDAAALAVASKSGITQSDADVLAQQYFNANYKLNNSFGTPAAVHVALANQSVTVTVQSNMPTTLMGIAGFQNVNLTAGSNVVWGQNKIWVGLALDNTGSMCEPSSQPCPTPGANTKIAALKTATHALLTMFQTAAATPGDVQVSLIPFSRDVKVDAATWATSANIDWSEWDENNGSCSNNNYSKQSTCTGAGSCSISGNNQTQCGTAGTCSVSGNNSQSACNTAGTCSVSGNNTQSACNTAGTCSVSGFSSSHNACNNAGTCSISGNTTQSSCTSASRNVCTIGGTVMNGNSYDTRSECEGSGVCSIAGYTSRSNCEAAYVGYVCRINGQNYTAAPRNNETGCEASANGICSVAGYTTRNACRARPTPNGTWYTGTWTGTGSRGVWTAGVWGPQYGVWTSTPGSWTPASWTPATWTPATWNPYVWTPTAHSNWNGCIADRGTVAAPSPSTTTSGYDIVNTTPGTAPESKFPAENYSQCPTTLVGLGYNWSTLSTKVDAMVAQGNTNQTIGLAWAWQSLTQGAPLSPPALPANTSRHIIILSDGENTANRWWGSGDKAKIDNRMHLLCTNAKADGITIWAVFVDVAGSAGSAASMEDCATGGATGGRYIKVTSASGIGTAFNVIGQQITNLRIAH